jgi:two-component system chemotaxis response regulator CheY
MELKDAKILIGDDSILARKQLRDVLAAMGASHFIEAVNGKEAVEKYAVEHPDIVFLDIIMPVMDGVAAVGEIMQIDPEALIIIVSSVGTQQQLKAAIEAGAKDFIQKPLKESQVNSIVSSKFD